MICSQAGSDPKADEQQIQVLKKLGRRPQGSKRSSRPQILRYLRKQAIVEDHLISENRLPPSQPAEEISASTSTAQYTQTLQKSTELTHKRKRSQPAEHALPRDRDQPSPKRLRPSPQNHIARARAVKDGHESINDPLYWILNGTWSKEYFEQDNLAREDFQGANSLQRHRSNRPLKTMHGFHLKDLLARKKSSSSIRRKSSDSSLRTPSDRLPREIKSAPYKTVEYEIGLENKGSYMREVEDDAVLKNITTLCKDLLEKDQTFPQDSLFRDDLFKKSCEKIRNRNETMVIRDIGSLIVPSAQTLATYGATHLNHLHESVNEGWNSANPFHGPRPQPDYSVGFGRSAFTEEQLEKLEPFIGDIDSRFTTYFMATTRMYFPFLCCEVKCGAAALDVADRQNAHSMTVALKGILELFRAVKREKELHQKVLGFSISHDHRSVRIYGHYAIIDEKNTFYRHPIKEFSFTSEDGKDKWTAYRFTKNVYDLWMSTQHERICSAIDDLPLDAEFDISQSASCPPSGAQSSQQSDNEDGDQPSPVGSQGGTPTTSFSQTTKRASKKPRNSHNIGQDR